LPATTASAAPVAASSSCSGVIRITHLAFNPDSAPPGQSSTVYLTAVNCTGTGQQTSATWLGKFTGGSGGSPVGCPEIDPHAQTATSPLMQRSRRRRLTTFLTDAMRGTCG
jgi:hypothetical protein